MYLFSIAAHDGDDLFFPPQMFEYMNSYDLACSVGGGEDSSAVLQRAGLTFICNCDLKTPLIESKIPADILFCELLFKIHVRGSKCDFFFFFTTSQSISVTTLNLNPAPGEQQTMFKNSMQSVRCKTTVLQSLIIPRMICLLIMSNDNIITTVNHYKNHDRKCCVDGVKLSKMHTSCDERLKRVKESDSCRIAFKKCCEAANERRRRQNFEKRKTSLGRGTICVA